MSKDLAYARNTKSGYNKESGQGLSIYSCFISLPESVFYTQSVMLSPRFIPESVFCTQSVVRSPCFILTDSNLDLPKLKKVRLLIQTSNLLGRSLKSFDKTIPYCKRFQAKLEQFMH